MAENNKMDLAKEVYATLCAALERREWHYKKFEEDFVVCFGVNGDDIPMDFIVAVDAERQLVRVMSPLPFKFSEGKRIDGAIAACVASFGLADGSFDYDISTGAITFRMTSTYRESKLGDALFQHMINVATVTVDRFNDRLLAVNKGIMSIEDFITGG